MEHRRERLAAYFSRLVGGLVACAVVSVTIHADVAAVVLVSAVMLVLLAIMRLMMRDAL